MLPPLAPPRPGKGHISYRFGVHFLSDTYPDVSCVYPGRIHVSWKDTCILTYPDVSQMYLTCSVTFQENTCILIFYMYFTRIPKESKIHLGYTSDTSRYMYLMRFLDVTLGTYQDTSGYMYLGLFITIHRDTSGYKITMNVYVRNTFRIHDVIHVSQMHPERNVS